MAGGIAAGVFLDAFREETPFLHIDIAGTSYLPTAIEGRPAGPTGFGVKTLYYYLKG